MKAIFRTAKAIKDSVLNLSPKAQTSPNKKSQKRIEAKVKGFELV